MSRPKGFKQTLEHIQKRVESRRKNGTYNSKHKGEKRPPRSENWSKNISLAKKGSIPWNKGLKTGPLSENHRKNIGIGNRGKKKIFTEEHKIKLRKILNLIAKSRKGSNHTQKTIEKIKLARSFQKLPMRDSKPEKMMQIALSLNNIKFKKHKMITDGKGFYHAVDIFIEPNICVEIDGDYIHGNPEIFSPDDKIINGKIVKEVWAKDIIINHKLNLLGYHVVRIWEKDIKVDAQECFLNIFKTNIVTNRGCI